MSDLIVDALLDQALENDEAFDITAPSEIIELPLGATRIICKDGYPYDFTPWKKLSPIVPLIAASFARSLSKHPVRKNARAGKEPCKNKCSFQDGLTA